MRFENSSLSKQYTYTKETLDFGVFYFFDSFIISEMNYGIHLCWKKIQQIIKLIQNHYGLDCKIGYISNKVNSYSYDPNLWGKFYKEYDFLIASVSVYYSDINYINATLEKQFSKKSIKRSDSIEEAVSWVLNLEELKESN
ncbi:hypothetical protein [Lacinutrix cladophorae]